jgi:RimJ/RimL family protein N-acetyltransferase
MTMLGKRLRLRAIERSDIPDFVRWFNDPEVRHYLQMFMPMSQAQEERWFEAQLSDTRSHVFGIETLTGKLIGNIGLHGIDWRESCAELGIVIGEKDYWNNGYGTEAIQALLRFAFMEMNLQRVSLWVYDYNERALHCYQKCGFQVEGRQRQAHYHEGRYHDKILMGILREEFARADQVANHSIPDQGRENTNHGEGHPVMG